MHHDLRSRTASASKPPVRRRLLAVAACTAALTAAVSTAAEAHWNQKPSGCTGISGGITCLYVYGVSGTTHVDHFVQARDNSIPQVCNYQAKFTVSQNDSVYWSRWSAYHRGCYYFYRVTRSSGTVEVNFRNPSRACGSWYENGGRLGTTCLTVFR